MSIFKFALAVFLMVPAVLYAQQPQNVGFKDYVQEVVAYYPSLKKQYANIEKALSQKALAASARMPRFWASADFQYGNDPVYVFGALLRQNKFNSDDFALNRLNEPEAYSNTSGSIRGQWLLFDFTQTASRIKSAGLLAKSAQFQTQMTEMEAILAACEVYSRLYLAQELLKALDQVTEESADDVSYAENLGKQGMLLGADFYLARVTQTQLMQTKNEIMAQEAALSMAFNILRGKDPAMPVHVDLDFRKEKVLGGDVKVWILKALKGRPDIKAMEKLLEAQGIETEREQKSFLPQISAFGQASDNFHGLNQSGGKDYVVGLKATMDIFDPSYKDRVKNAKAQTDYLKEQYQESMDQAAKDTAEAFYELQALKSNDVLARMALNDARQVVDLMEPLYKEGRRSIIQMISARAGYLSAFEHWMRLQYAFRQNILSLKLYAGELNQQEADEIYGQ